MKRTICLFASVGLLGCGSGARSRCGRYKITERRTLFLWVEDSVRLAPQTVLAGCNFWNAVGIICRLRRSKSRAHVRVYDNPITRCEQGSYGGRVIGRAYPGGRIELFSKCMNLNDGTLVNISAHEIGHELGVSHTLQEIDSVMSPVMGRTHKCLLQWDIKAWTARDRFQSVLESKILEEETPWCVLPMREN